MSIIDKLKFWKKKDNFDSLLQDSSNLSSQAPLPPLDNQDPLAKSANPYGQASESLAATGDPLTHQPTASDQQKYQEPQDPYAQPTQQPISPGGSPQANFDHPAPQESQEVSLGRSLARKYVAQNEAQQQSTSRQTSESKGSSMQVLELKVDAMKSELALANQRLQKIEQLLESKMKKQW